MEQVDLLNMLFEKVAQNKVQYFVSAYINNDGTFEIAWSGSASYLERIGLMEQAKQDIIDSVYSEDE